MTFNCNDDPAVPPPANEATNGHDSKTTNTPLVTVEDVESLLTFFHSLDGIDRRNSQVVSKLNIAQEKCLKLLQKDYDVDVIGNQDGHLCATYPLDLYVLLRERHCQDTTNVTDPNQNCGYAVNDASMLRAMFQRARFSRVRGRFAVPVLLIRGRNVCRSSTISQEAEIKLNLAQDRFKNFFYGNGNCNNNEGTQDFSLSPQPKVDGKPQYNDPASSTTSKNGNVCHSLSVNSESSEEESVVGRLRQCDIRLLWKLGVTRIVDLMVETKKVKYGLSVCSSEKVDSKDRYGSAKIELVPMPYPGVEFFRVFRDSQYNSSRCFFDWSQSTVNSHLHIPNEDHFTLDINWRHYRSWSLSQLTKNYLRLLLAYLGDNSDTILDSDNPSTGLRPGFLAHCISGWDRTNLFISLLRMSLWADGEIHQSLSAIEIVYLTVAYDWMLFSHLLKDRVGRHEEIFFFCFHFLCHITDDSFTLDSCVATRKDSTEENVAENRSTNLKEDECNTDSRDDPVYNNSIFNSTFRLSIDEENEPTKNDDVCLEQLPQENSQAHVADISSISLGFDSCSYLQRDSCESLLTNGVDLSTEFIDSITGVTLEKSSENECSASSPNLAPAANTDELHSSMSSILLDGILPSTPPLQGVYGSWTLVADSPLSRIVHHEQLRNSTLTSTSQRGVPKEERTLSTSTSLPILHDIDGEDQTCSNRSQKRIFSQVSLNTCSTKEKYINEGNNDGDNDNKEGEQESRAENIMIDSNEPDGLLIPNDPYAQPESRCARLLLARQLFLSCHHISQNNIAAEKGSFWNFVSRFSKQ